MVRDNLNRGVNKEFDIINFILGECDVISVNKNSNEYDIDVVLELPNNKKALIEIEETSLKNWPPNKRKPLVPSKLFTIPLRKIKYFVEESELLSSYLKTNSTIKSIAEFNSIIPKKTKYKVKTDCYRIYIKGSYNLKNLCIVKSRLIVNSLNYVLKDQTQIDKRKNIITTWNPKWKFQKNIWENNSVKNYSNQFREDPLLLIVGHLEYSKDLIWIEEKELCQEVLEKLK